MRVSKRHLDQRLHTAYVHSGHEVVEIWVDPYHARINIRYPDRPKSGDRPVSGEIVGRYNRAAEQHDIREDIVFVLRQHGIEPKKGDYA